MFFLKVFIFLFPWKFRRLLLIHIFGYEIHSTAKIGIAWVFPAKLKMDAFSYIDHFTIAINLDEINLGKHSSIGRSNWITGFSSTKKTKHFEHQKGIRNACLNIGQHSSITKNHHIDCTNQISIGSFTTIAGYNSQLLTHSINIEMCRQDSTPICIGDYCFIGTNVVILGGAVLPSFSILGAKSLLNKPFKEQYFLYGGVPAKQIKELELDLLYFKRNNGFVY